MRNFFTHLLQAVHPNQTGETLTRQNRIESLSGRCRAVVEPFTRVNAFRAVLFALILSMGVTSAWGADFTPQQIINGATSGNITVSSAIATSASNQKVCNTNVSTVSIDGTANGNGNTKYIEIKADAGYTISSLSINASINKTDGGTYKIGVAFFEGEYSTTVTDKTEIVIANKNATSGCGPFTISVPSGIRTVRIYRGVKINASNQFNGSGTQYGSAQNTYVAGISATAAASASTWYVKGGWNSWGTTNPLAGSGTELSATVNIETAGLYEFKIHDTSGDAWYSNTGNIGCNVSDWAFSTSVSGNCKFFASETGNYTFTFNTETKALSVTYPTAQGKYYYKNTGSWGTVTVYRYVGSINNGWPGTQVVETETICGETYYFTYADPATTLIFNNNNGGSQTGNMAASGNAGKYVQGTESSWRTFSTFTVTYNGNGSTGGSVPTDSNSPYACGSSVTVLGNTSSLVKTGHTFTGWNTAADGSGTGYTAGNTFTISANTTLYAQWELVQTYDVIYNANGGTGTTASQTGNLTGAQVTTSANSFTRSGYKFKWWNTAANGSGEDFYPGEKVTIASANVTLYAQWEEVAVDWAFWCGDDLTTSPTNIAGNGATLRLTRNGVDYNTDFTQASTEVSKHGDIAKHAKVVGIGSNNKYLQVEFSDASPINSLILGVTTNNDASKNIVVCFSTTSDFSTGEYEFKKVGSTNNVVAVPGKAQTSKAFTTVSPSTTNKYKYARIYRKLSNGTDYNSTGGDLGSGNTTRVYAVKAEKGISCSTPTAPTNFTAGSITTTGVTFTITDAANANKYDIYYSTSSTAPVAATAATTTSTSKTVAVTGLTAGTAYYAWVRSVCDASHKSAWVALNPGGSTHTFTTSCIAPTSVNITGAFHYFPGNEIHLTSEPSNDGAGEATYQWYKGGTAEGNKITGATSATYTKANCVVGDAGSYYCKVTCGGSCSTMSGAFDVKILQILLKTSAGADIDYYTPSRVGSTTTASVAINLTGGTTYKFRITDGCNNWYGNTGEMTSSNCTNWAMDADADCRITTNSKTASYLFTIDYTNGLLGSQLRVSVTYPGGDQAAGTVIYWDNDVNKWSGSSLWYRIGRGDHNAATQLTLVPGTANLYQVTTAAYNGFEYWHIANNKGDVGAYSIDLTKSASYPITHAMAFEGGNVTGTAVTVTPSTSHATGIRANNDNCEFYPYTITSGMKTQNVSITAPTNGTITVDYTDVNNAAQSFTSGNRDLAHTVIITPTATPATGYQLSGLTVNNAAHTSGTTYTAVSGTVVAATFSPQVYTITYKDGGNTAFSGTHESGYPTTHTYATATTLKSATKDGYVFGGWFDNSACSGDAVTSLGATAYTADITLYAKWTLDTGCKTWAGTPSAWTDGKMTISLNLVIEADPNDATKTAINENAVVWGNSHKENVIAISGTDNYIQGYFNDGSAISTVTICAANNNSTAGTDKNYLVLFCANSSFTTGVTGQLHAAPSFKDDQNDTKLVHEFTAPAGTKYFRVYRKINNDVGDYSKSSGAGDGQTTRIYRIEVCPAATYTVTYKANGGTGSDIVHNVSTVEANTFTAPAHKGFTGWNTASNGSGTAYAVGDAVTSDLTLFAQWGDLYTLTYNVNGGNALSPSSAEQASIGAAITLPTPTSDGYDCTGWWTASSGGTKRGDAGESYTPTSNETLYAQWTEHVESECVTITNFATSNSNNTCGDGQSKIFYGYKGSVSDANALTITSNDGNDHGQNSGAEMRLTYNKKMRIYANNTTNATPAGFENVVSVSFKWKFIASGNSGKTELTSSYTVKVGAETIADAVSITGKTNDGYATVTIDNFGQLDGYVEILFGGSSSSYNVYLDDIEICTADMATCTTPTIPNLSNQAVCPGNAVSAWDAMVTNASAISAAGETISYKWQLKNGSNWDDISGATSATYDVDGSGTATEAMAGTYRVVVTVSKTGYTSSTATKEVTLSVTAATETPTITGPTGTVYAGNSVTLTATSTAGATWQWAKCTNAEGAGATNISGATSATYTFTAPAAGTHYYKATATTSCSSASAIYTLTVSAASECEIYYWFIYADDATNNGVVNNRDGFFSNVTTGTGNTSTYTMTVDGTVMTGTKRLSTGAYAPKFTVPIGATATLYIYGKAASADAGKHLVLKRTSDNAEVEVTNSTTVQAYTKENIESGEWTLSCGSSNWCYSFFAVKVCAASTCTDATPVATAAATTVCSGSELSITATGYESSPTSIQWQKLNGSAWENISGATSATYTVASAAAANAGSYRVIVTKECARTSNTVTIAVPSAPVFGTVPSTVSVMVSQALSISNVEATDATSYKWYKSANNSFDAGTDTEIGTSRELIKPYDGETVKNKSYYLFCVASNSCGSTTSSAIAVNVTAYVEEDCATRGNEGEAEFGFENTSMSSGSLESKNVWYKSQNSSYLTYSAPANKFLATAKVTIASSNSSNASYQYSTNNGTTWSSGITISSMSTTLTEKTIDLSAYGNVTDFRIGRNLDGAGESSGTFYLHKACFEYTESCASATVTPSAATKTYTIGGAYSAPTFTVKDGNGIAFDPQPALTYSSSDPTIADVNESTGEVSFNGKAGVVTITAAYAGDATYCASQGSYKLTIKCPGGAPKVVPASSTNMSGCNTSITLEAKDKDDADFVGGSYQWYRNGDVISGATSKSYTAVQAGTYTVEYTTDAGCTSLSSNQVTITSDNVEPEVKHLVPFQNYHVDKTYTDFMKMRHLFTVKGSAAYGSTGKNFKLELQRNGGTATDVTTSNSFAVWPSVDRTVDTVMIDLNKLASKYTEGDKLFLTCKAVDCSGNVSETYKDTITIRVIDQTPTLALILNGKDSKVGGDYLKDYEPKNLQQQTGGSSWSGEWSLYTELKEHYRVTPVSGYAEFYKLNYEPFDIVFLTDFPKAKGNDAAATILDNMVELVDYRPFFTFKTHMVHKSPSKWAAKGFTTAPVSDTKNAGKLNLNIVCYAHPMFESIKTGTDVYNDLGNESAPLVYKMLSGAGYENSKGMQGFEVAAAENFVTIGLTHHNATIAYSGSNVTWTSNSGDRMLVTAAERQTNIEARMILFSLNAGAHSKLTDKGEQVVLKCLEYLLDNDPLHVADCSFTFDNGANNEHDAAWYTENCPKCKGTKGDGLWSTQANWGPDYRLLPGEFTSVRIAAPVNVDLTHAHVMEARIVESGKITIPAGKALEVKSTIRRIDGTEISPTDVSDISIGSTASGNGTLIFNNNGGDSKARVAMYSKAKAAANLSAAKSKWQYIGTPHSDISNAQGNYYDSWLYKQNASYSDWEAVPNRGSLEPFRGYCVTHPDAPVIFDMVGTLAATTSQDIAIPAGKYVVVANSWVAPIDINTIADDDMEGITDKSIYFFNTGTDTVGTGELNKEGGRWAAGTYVSVPIHSAPYTGDDHIPSMQGFYVVGGASNGTLHLDYDKHVRGHSRSSIVSGRMHAPRRTEVSSDEPTVLKLFARGSRYDDRLIVLEREDFTRSYDSGWDGEAWGGSDLSPMVYITNEDNVDEAVSAIPDYEGTIISFKAGEDSEYYFDFVYGEEEETLYLLDTDNSTYTQVVTGNTYHFTTSDKSAHKRFILTHNMPGVATGVENAEGGEGIKAVKFIDNNKLFIFTRGVLYDATGKVVK